MKPTRSPRAQRTLAATLVLSLGACAPASGGADFGYAVTGSVDNTGATGPEFCALASGEQVPGAEVPAGLCIRRYGGAPVARVMAFAPNGDLFVSSPSGTIGGASGGTSSILVMHDDDRDGRATVETFMTGVPTVQGVALRGEWIYFATSDGVWRTPYRPGLRREDGERRERVGTYPSSATMRPTHGVAVSPGGVVYASIGVQSNLTCPDTPREGSVRTVNPSTGNLSVVAEGFRNPMYVRCHPTDELCVASELGDDGGASYGAREKLVRLRPDTNYGFPCCATQGTVAPYNGGRYDCSQTTREEQSFGIGDTPFGFDWERGRWPEPFRSSIFLALHGAYASVPVWRGARVVFAATDPTTHLPTGEFRDVVRGFGPRGSALERPADAVFSPDGRLFIADDHGGAVYWIAPVGLRAPAGG